MGKPRPTTPVTPPNHQQGRPLQGLQLQQTQTIQSPVPPGEVLDRLAPHIDRVGERWMGLFESNVGHQQSMEKETLRVNESLQNKALDTQGVAVRQDGENIRRGQWIAGALLFTVCLIFALLIWVAYKLFMSDKPWPAVAFTAFAGALGWAFRSIVMGYLGKATPPPKKG